MIHRCRNHLLRYQRNFKTKGEESVKNMQKHLPSRLSFTVRLLIGLMEDFPVILLLYYSMVIPFCGVYKKEDAVSPTTLATIVSSMLNSMWTMLVLYWDLLGCYKKVSNAECCCNVIRTAYESKTLMSICYCGCCGCATTSNCVCVCLQQIQLPKNSPQPSDRNGQNKCKRIALRVGKIFLIGIIFLLYLANFILSSMILSNVFYEPILEKSVLVEYELTKSIISDNIGPGLDSGTDSAMFVTMVYKLPNWYHVGLYDNRNVNIANSASVYQIQNRLYIGQFNELEHLKDGTITKVIPCNRVFPFLDKINQSLFQWKSSQKFNFTDFSKCKIIFRLRYYPTNNNWNPFVNFIHTFFKYITVEWGVYIADSELCPTGFKPLPVSSFLTETVKQDIVNYTCSPPCINATDICRESAYGTFEKSDCEIFSTVVTGEPEMYLTVNDQQYAYFCQFRTIFKYTTEFCNEFWEEFPPVRVPDFVRETYPQFITVPMTYKKKDKTSYLFLDSKCSNLWKEGYKISF